MLTPQLLAAALRAAANALDGGNVAATQQSVAPAALTPAPVMQQPITPAAPQTVTDADLLALIQPHLDNAALKAELGNVMRGMGINGLPEAQPHQFGPLYAAFQGVLARYGIGGPAPSPAPAATSII